MKLKVCGMRAPQNIEEVLTLSPDYLGFIFYEKSPRFVANIPETIDFIKSLGQVKKVGVFVNAPVEELLQIAQRYDLQVIQLHGKESVETCRQVREQGYEVFKVFGVGEDFDFSVLKPYEEVVDYFLFDTKSKQHGGTGKTFDWSVLQGYDSKVPFFLSGGVSLENLEEVKQLNLSTLYGIDVNSRFENAPALKDVTLLKELKKGLQS
ncbi:phosphoribosylanthranilate isomerase [Algivirga pacifica]